MNYLSYLQDYELPFYKKKGKLPAAYNLARKEAFLAMGNFSAAFQRMTQEPRSKQKDLDYVYKLVSLNNELLASEASLGTFIKTHKTSPASKHFKIFLGGIQQNLSNAVELMEEKSLSQSVSTEEMETAIAHFKRIFFEVTKLQNGILDPNVEAKHPADFQETQLVLEQLRWLWQIATDLKKIVEKHQK